MSGALFKLFNGKLQKGKTNNTTKRKVKKQTSKSTFRRCLKWKVLVFTKHIIKVQKTFFTNIQCVIYQKRHIKQLSSQTSSVSYIKRGISSSIHKGCNIGHGLFSPVAGLSFDSKNIFLQSGFTDMTTSCSN